MTDSELAELVAQLLTIVDDYAVLPMSTDHVHRWLAQFPADTRVPVLAALVPTLTRTYFSRKRIEAVVRALAATGLDPAVAPAHFWSTVGGLELGVPGHSQEYLYALLRAEVGRQHGIELASGSGGEFLLLDDHLFSGTCAVETLRDWLLDPRVDQRRVHLVFLAAHSFGLARAHRALSRAAADAGKDVRLCWWHELRIEDHPRSGRSDVLRPLRPPPAGAPARWPAMDLGPADQPALADVFLAAGQEIKQSIVDPAFYVRPLGYQGIDSFGFGTTVMTYRGCPNHAPLALWFGDPGGRAGPPWDVWYPLLPRPMARQRLELRGLPERFFAYDDDLALVPPPVSRPLASLAARAPRTPPRAGDP